MKTLLRFVPCLSLLTGMAAVASAHQIQVLPGHSIQAAVDRARPGDRVVVFPGVYHEAGRPCPDDPSKNCAVVVEHDGIALIGASRPGHPVVLENAGSQDDGIAVGHQGAKGSQCLADRSQRIAGAAVAGFTVTGFARNGILLFCVDNWTVAENLTENNGLYGIFPSHSGTGTLHHNVATGAHDTGIYVGQSHDVLETDNVAHDNVSGFELENCERVVLHHNESFGNTAGILLFLSPGLDISLSRDNVVDGNLVHDNNAPNTCPPGDSVCLVPAGSGILVIGGTGNVVAGNRIHGNESGGLYLLDTCTAFQVPASQCGSLGFDPLPESSRIEHNTVTGNGSNPQTTLFPGADLLWAGIGTGNCWEDNTATVIIPSALPACP
jgi:cytochrome c peroxidase